MKSVHPRSAFHCVSFALVLVSATSGLNLAGDAFASETKSFRDDFSQPKLKRRRAVRGDWKFHDRTASVTQDDQLYKKFKNHGPILFYDVQYRDAEIRFAVRPQDTRTVVFTANGEDGHVFRFVLSKAGLNVRAFPADADAKSIALARREKPVLPVGEWTDIVVRLKGNTATVSIGTDFQETYQHPSLDESKTNFSVGFSFGSLDVRGVAMTY